MVYIKKKKKKKNLLYQFIALYSVTFPGPHKCLAHCLIGVRCSVKVKSSLQPDREACLDLSFHPHCSECHGFFTNNSLRKMMLKYQKIYQCANCHVEMKMLYDRIMLDICLKLCLMMLKTHVKNKGIVLKNPN